MDEAESAPLDVRRPFTVAAARAGGVDPGTLRGVGFRRVFNGVYVASSVPVSPELRAKAALTPFVDTAWASHASAARILGVPIPTLPDEHVGVRTKKERRNRPGIRSHVNPSPEVRTVDGYRVSDWHQLFGELASQVGLVDLVIVGDHLVRKGHTTPAKLVAWCERSTLPTAAEARRAAAYVREGVDSPMETRLRMLLVLAGLPEPAVNLVIRDVDGEPMRKYDLSYQAVKTLVEYDGRHHIDRVEQWESDLDRREAIDEDEWRIIVVTSRGIFKEPARTVQRVWTVLRKRGMPGTPLRPSDAWRPHFPGHANVA